MDEKLKQWIKVISPALVYMILHSILKHLFSHIFKNARLDMLGNIENLIFVSALSSIVIFPIVLVWYCRVNKNLRVKKLNSFSQYLELILEIVGIVLAISLTDAFIMDQIYGDFSDNSGSSLFEIIAFGIIAPISEELIYRDIVFRRCENYFGKAFAVIFSGILFGIAHQGFVQILIAIGVGMIFNLIYVRYQNVIVTIAVHIGINLLSYSTHLGNLPIIIQVIGIVSLVLIVINLLCHFNDKSSETEIGG